MIQQLSARALRTESRGAGGDRILGKDRQELKEESEMRSQPNQGYDCQEVKSHCVHPPCVSILPPTLMTVSSLAQQVSQSFDGIMGRGFTGKGEFSKSF